MSNGTSLSLTPSSITIKFVACSSMMFRVSQFNRQPTRPCLLLTY